jgi:hypothetical protein
MSFRFFETKSNEDKVNSVIENITMEIIDNPLFLIIFLTDSSKKYLK